MTETEMQRLADLMLERSGKPGYFSSKVGNRYTELSVEGGVGYVTATRDNCNPLGILHGGVYYTLMDQLTGMAAGAPAGPR
ncbi:MAG: hypothetical protein IJ751_03685 [Oscillospiraceae bacterium]|nr:hypothetical protein [Oscillospiraceae bacterium]